MLHLCTIEIGKVPEVMCPTIVVYDSSQLDSSYNGRYKVSGYTVDFDKERPNAPVYLCETCNIEVGAATRKIYWIGDERHAQAFIKGWCIGYYFPGDDPVDRYCST